MTVDNRSPQARRGGSKKSHNPHRGSVRTTAREPKEERLGEEDATFRQNKAYTKKRSGPLS